MSTSDQPRVAADQGYHELRALIVTAEGDPGIYEILSNTPLYLLPETVNDLGFNSAKIWAELCACSSSPIDNYLLQLKPEVKDRLLQSTLCEVYDIDPELAHLFFDPIQAQEAFQSDSDLLNTAGGTSIGKKMVNTWKPNSNRSTKERAEAIGIDAAEFTVGALLVYGVVKALKRRPNVELQPKINAIKDNPIESSTPEFISEQGKIIVGIASRDIHKAWGTADYDEAVERLDTTNQLREYINFAYDPSGSKRLKPDFISKRVDMRIHAEDIINNAEAYLGPQKKLINLAHDKGPDRVNKLASDPDFEKYYEQYITAKDAYDVGKTYYLKEDTLQGILTKNKKRLTSEGQKKLLELGELPPSPAPASQPTPPKSEELSRVDPAAGAEPKPAPVAKDVENNKSFLDRSLERINYLNDGNTPRTSKWSEISDKINSKLDELRGDPAERLKYEMQLPDPEQKKMIVIAESLEEDDLESDLSSEVHHAEVDLRRSGDGEKMENELEDLKPSAGPEPKPEPEPDHTFEFPKDEISRRGATVRRPDYQPNDLSEDAKRIAGDKVETVKSSISDELTAADEKAEHAAEDAARKAGNTERDMTESVENLEDL